MGLRTCLITGATSGIGRATAEALAGLGFKVLVAGRDQELGEAVLSRIRDQGGAAEFLKADLASQAEVRGLAAAVLAHHPRLDVLVNNAALVAGKRTLTVDGIEMVFAVNHLAPFLLTNLLLPALRAAGRARIVTVSSDAHQGGAMDLDDVANPRRYGALAAYRCSKLANLLFTYELARRLADEGSPITANALHPGFVASRIGTRHGWLPKPVWWLLSRLARNPRKGARTSVYLATSPEVEGISGRYFIDCREMRSSPESLNATLARDLWQASERWTGR